MVKSVLQHWILYHGKLTKNNQSSKSGTKIPDGILQKNSRFSVKFQLYFWFT